MIADFGFGMLVVAFLTALYSAGAALFGALKNRPAWIDSARYGMLLTWPLITAGALSIIALLLTRHYEVAYVYDVTSDSMPTYLKITALWGGQAGSLVFWSWLMAAFASAVMLRKWNRDREFLPWVIVVCCVTLAFFLGLILFSENPFARIWITPTGQQLVSMMQPAGASLASVPDGRGLNPLLRHPGMIIHPPMLYLGFVSFVIPYAFAVAALVTGRTDDRWIRITRRWTLVAWLFLSTGLFLGMRWAYDVLGWGGFWGWDPVEIAALMPWLSGTAFVHSVMIQEKRGMMKRWNLVLIILTYDLVIFGTFLTRSGVLSSVHAFAESSIGPAFFAFIGITFAISLGLLLYRWPDLKAEMQMTSLLSRESLFLVNNLLFMGILIVCFWGVVFPLISELVTGQKITVGPPFYTRATGPLWAGLLLLMGIAPLSAWAHSTVKTLGKAIWKPMIASVVVVVILVAGGMRSIWALVGFWLAALVVFVTLFEYARGAWARHNRAGENLPLALWRLMGRNRRRYGGYLIHLGVVFAALGIMGMQFFQTETQGSVAVGQAINLDGYTVTYRSLAVFDTQDGRNVARAVVDVSKDGQFLAELHPRRDYFYESQQPMTIPGVRSTLNDDVYVILVDWQPISSEGATFKVYHNPLINELWIGALIFILGALFAGWPEREKEPVEQPAVRRGVSLPSKA
jgi:cytochrome c-type biogenesis protein CcmF